MSIWFKDYRLEDLISRGQNTMIEFLGIELSEIGEDYLVARMPVNERTKQPEGLLHGGASVVLAETLGSVGAFLCIDPSHKQVFGLEINANHVRAVREGYVEGVARPLHLGNNVHIWEVKIRDDKKKLVCISRITLMIKNRRVSR